MATKAKLSLSQLLFRRTSTSNNGYVNGGNSGSNGVIKSDHCGGHGDSSSYNGHGSSRKVSSSSMSSSGRSGFYEISSPPDILPQKVDHVQQQQQLHGILKKPSRNDVDNSGGCKLIKSTLHRSRSNPNPSNNPLKEVSWSCPTLEKRREVILNYFERIILENKQEQNGKMRTTKPNIPCESERDSSGGEPIYEEISDCKSFNNSTTNNPDKMGSLKPKVMPKKVRMNIPQDQRSNTNGASPIYDKVLCRSHSMIEPPVVASAYDTLSSSASSSSSSTISSQSLYENFRPAENDYGNRRAGRSHSFHDNFLRPVSSSSNSNNVEHYNIQVDSGDPEQLYAKVCKRKKMIKVSDHLNENQHEQPTGSYKPVNGANHVVDDELRVEVSCANVVTMIPVIMPCSSSFSTSCLSLSSSSDNNTDDTTTTTRGNNNYVHPHHHHHHNDDNEEHYREKILPDKEIAYVKCDNRSRPNNNNNKNNLSVIHLLATYDPAKEMEEFIPTTPSSSSSSFTAIIDSTECAPRSISIPVRGEYTNNNKGIVSNADSSSSHSPPSSTTPLMVTNCSFGFSDEHHHHVGLVVSDKKSVAILSASDDEDEDDVRAKYEIGRVKGLSSRSGGRTSITQVESDTTKDLLLLTSDSEDDICETKSILSIMNPDLIDVSVSSNGKYIPDDEDRGFDSFLDDNDSGLADKNNENPFKAENLRNQRTFSQLQQDVPQDALKKKAASVLDLINSEISDLHMRELELKKIHGSSPLPPTKLDKEDHHGTNLEEFEEGSSEDDFSDSAIEYDGFTTNGSNSSGQVSPSQNLSEVVQQEEQERILLEKSEDARPSENRVRPLLEEDDKSIKFDVTQETPIEREIRVTRDREEEFRRLNKLSTQTTSLPVMVQRSESRVENTASLAKTNNVASRPENLDKSSDAPKKDVQYRMATDRLKREIEESMQREKELMLEGRLKKGDDESINDEPSPVAEPEKEEQTTKLEEVSSPPPPPAVVQEGLRKPTLAKPITKMPAARFFSPPAYNGNKPNRITPVVSPIINKGRFDYPTSGGDRVVGGSLPIGINRPNFTSLEKYILQSSYNYNNPKSNEEQVIRIAESIKQQPIIPEDPLRIIQKPITDEDPEEDTEEEEKPKRRYIPAQDKIHKEIEELAMREKELTITRAKWKSTLDLPESFDDDDVNEVNTRSTMSLDIRSSSAARGDNGGARDPVRSSTESPAREIMLEELHKQPADENKKGEEEDDDVFKVKVPPRRRHSVLISQWEERIRQQQQTTNKK